MPNSIRPYLSTSLKLALLIGVLTVAGQWVSQSLFNDVLERTVRQREFDKVDALARLVAHRIKQQGRLATLVASMAAGDADMGATMQLADAQRRTRFADVLENLAQNGDVDTLEVIGADEVVVYRAMHPEQFGDVTASWGVAEAMAGVGQLVLRTPLNGVLGLTELLLQTPLSDEQKRYAALISASGKSLNDLLGDILDVAKIEEGRCRARGHVPPVPAIQPGRYVDQPQIWRQRPGSCHFQVSGRVDARADPG